MEELEVLMRYDFRWVEIDGTEREVLSARLRMEGNTGWRTVLVQKDEKGWWVLLEKAITR